MTPDKSPAESCSRSPTSASISHWGGFFWKSEFPNGINYTVGQSDPPDNTSNAWTVNFTMDEAPLSDTDVVAYYLVSRYEDFGKRRRVQSCRAVYQIFLGD